MTATREELQQAEDRITGKITKLHERVDSVRDGVIRNTATLDRAVKDIEAHAVKHDQTERVMGEALGEWKATTLEMRGVREDIARMREAQGGPKHDDDATAFQVWLLEWRQALTPSNIVRFLVMAGIVVTMLSGLLKGNVDNQAMLEQLDRLEKLERGFDVPDPKPQPVDGATGATHTDDQ